MLPGDRLDALLIVRSRGVRSDEGEMAPLLDMAARFEPLAMAQPEPAFADALEARLLAFAAASSGGRLLEAAPIAAGEQRAAAPVGTPAINRPPARARKLPWLAPFRRRPAVLWPALAAVLAVTFAIGALGVAAAAPPGSPFYGVRQWEDGMRVSLAASPTDRVHLHLRYAADALDALDRSVAQHTGETTYRDALATLQREYVAAERDLAMVPAGKERDTLATEASGLRSRARHDLRAALRSLSWPDRLATTNTLGTLGDAVPTVVGAHLTRTGDHQWQVTLTGSGFQPGAVFLVNGAPTGTTLAILPGRLTAEIRDAGMLHHAALGVGNPDGTAVEATQVPGTEADDHGTDASSTATAGARGGSGGSGDGSGGDGNHRSTPSPTPRH